jgi:ADP-heptose:LPS heptosyltransferase
MAGYMNPMMKTFKKAATAPVAPRAFSAVVNVLRLLGALRRPSRHTRQSVQRILVSCTFDSVGDVILLIPLLESIQTHWPDALLDVAVGERMSELIEKIPFIHKVFRYRTSKSALAVLNAYSEILQLLLLYRREIMKYDYDLSIAPRWTSDKFHMHSVYLAYVTGSELRCAYSAKVDDGDTEIDVLLTRATQGGAHEHEVLRNLKLLNRSGLISDVVQDATFVSEPFQPLIALADANADKITSLAGMTVVPKAGYIVISPGATNARRIWPIENYVELIQKLQSDYEFEFIILGSHADATLADRITDHSTETVISLAGKTDIFQVLSIIRKASLFIGSDSGTAHIAGAVGTPTVVISPFPQSCTEDHPNSPERFRPCGPQVQLVQPVRPLPGCDPTCRLDISHCITQIDVDRVIAAARKLLRSSGSFPFSPLGRKDLDQPGWVTGNHTEVRK